MAPKKSTGPRQVSIMEFAKRPAESQISSQAPKRQKITVAKNHEYATWDVVAAREQAAVRKVVLDENATAEDIVQEIKKHDFNRYYNTWTGEETKVQVALRGMSWKISGMGYEKKDAVIQRVKERDENDRRARETPPPEPLPEVTAALSNTNVPPSSAPPSSKAAPKPAAKKYHTVLTPKAKSRQQGGTKDADLWVLDNQEQPEGGADWKFEIPYPHIPRKKPQKNCEEKKKGVEPEADDRDVCDGVVSFLAGNPLECEDVAVVDEDGNVKDNNENNTNTNEDEDDDDEDDDEEDDNNENENDMADSESSEEPTEYNTPNKLAFSEQQRFLNAADKYEWVFASKRGYWCRLCKKHLALAISAKRPDADGSFFEVPCCDVTRITKKKCPEHAKTASHVAAVEAERTRNSGTGMIVKTSKAHQSMNRRQLLKLTANLYWLVKRGVSHSTNYASLAQHSARWDADLKAFIETKNASYTSRRTMQELLDAINTELQFRIESRVRQSKYITVLADETQDICRRSELSVYIRGVDGKGESFEHFWGIAPLTDGKGAAGVYTDIAERVSYMDVHRARGVPLETDEQPPAREMIGGKKIVGVGFDGTNTMSGGFSGVQTRFKYFQNIYIIYVWCRNHQLNLSLQWAGQSHVDVMSAINSQRDIYWYVRSSGERVLAVSNACNQLKQVVEWLNLPDLQLEKGADTRWLTNEKGCTTLLNTLPSIHHALSQIHQQDGDAITRGLLETLESPRFVAANFLLASVFIVMKPLNLKLQESCAGLVMIPDLLKSTQESLERLAEGVENGAEYKYLQWTTYYNTVVARLSGKKVCPEAFLRFHETTTRSYVKDLIAQLTARFCDSAIFTNIAVLDPQRDFGDKPDEDEALIHNLTHFFCTKRSQKLDGYPETKSYDPPYNDHDKQTIRFQLTLLLTKIRQQREASANPAKYTFSDAVRYAVACHSLTLPKAVDFLLRVACLPGSTAVVERAFSVLKLVLTRLRASMLITTLDALMRIKIEGPQVPSLPLLNSVVDRFIKAAPKTGRRRDFGTVA